MSKQRKRYSAALKSKVALEANKGVRSANEIATHYGVHPNQVGQWNFNLEQKPGGSEMQPAETPAERCRSRESLDHFSPLDEAATEALALHRVLKDASVLSGDQATEASVKQVHGPRILHLITHGFFQENQKQVGRNLQETMWGSNTFSIRDRTK